MNMYNIIYILMMMLQTMHLCVTVQPLLDGNQIICTCLRADEYFNEYLESPNYPHGYGE